MSTIVTFNPFNKELRDIVPDDLLVLRSVAEGWYVEYKGQLVAARSIAKSISAFANHYGGWLFYGIEETKDRSNKAGDFPGLDQSEVTQLIETVRNAVKDSISPSPYYEYHIIAGPCAAIGLPSNRSIVIVLVPSGPNPPYIHNDGRIYRRVADCSDPKAETDRFILDQLWQRGQKSEAQLTSFLKTRPILSEGEEDTSYFELFFLPDPLGAKGERSNLKFKQFIESMSDKASPGMSFLCDNFFTMADGMVGRQIGTNDPYNLVLTWKHYWNGASVISAPLSSARLDKVHVGGWLSGYKYESRFIQLMRSDRHRMSYLLDINQLLFVIMAAVNQQQRLMASGGVSGPLYAKTALRNIWRRIPYIDTESYMNLVSKYGFPIIQSKDEFAPPGTTFDSLVLIDAKDINDAGAQGSDEPIINHAVLAAPLWGGILNALGVSTMAVMSDEDGEADKTDFWGAASRAAEVNKIRSSSSPEQYQ